jgi:hypothetical protein
LRLPLTMRRLANGRRSMGSCFEQNGLASPTGVVNAQTARCNRDTAQSRADDGGITLPCDP